MENTRENVVKLLEKMIESNNVIADTFGASDPEFSGKAINHAIDYQICVWFLTNPEYFNKIYNIYFNEEEN